MSGPHESPNANCGPRPCHAGDALQWACVALGLLPAAGLCLVIAVINLAVFRDPRQILFAQDRVGRNGRPFRVLKFRTMRAPRGSEIDSWAAAGDQLRVTRFGRWLRNSHLDELPQLINVLRGEMRLIGPRPEMREIESWAAEAVEGFSERLAIRPGITGYAQIVQGYTGRSAQAYGEKFALSMAYLHYRRLGVDVWILWRTVLTILRLEGWSWSPSQTGTLSERAAAGRALSHPLEATLRAQQLTREAASREAA